MIVVAVAAVVISACVYFFLLSSSTSVVIIITDEETTADALPTVTPAAETYGSSDVTPIHLYLHHHPARRPGASAGSSGSNRSPSVVFGA
jgi:hypothetical protein